MPSTNNRHANLLSAIGFAALMVWTANLPAGAQSSDTLFDYPETVLNGPISATVNIPLQESCRRLCSTRSGCIGFDYASAGGICRMFSAVVGAANSNDHTAGTRSLIQNYRQPANPPAPPPAPAQEETIVQPPAASFSRFVNRDLTGGSIASMAAGSIDQCEAMCQSTGRSCQAYTYDAWNRRCFLKSETGQLILNARAISGVLTDIETPVLSGAPVHMEYFNNKAFSGEGFRVLASPSREACANECWGAGQCVAFGFTSSQRRCVLFDQPGEYFSSRGTDSGAKRQN
ncbi:PAN domain-containing protein [Mesorhizobium humile]|uniref:PAN domain-containing protein n=1 Tax=Mesorhizobium humile TaxID=3072313 RepID=A0ABU4YJB9_9HYPH|nr:MULTISPECIES: PAN domain-containing protein [unclassified Mesorhizobium]MDX8457258.1 PAN domain-containing protein [Mesorhizobium sp. VK2D]MDX8487051.1 PAN domain-containing protein [Mesorhizobium sp. VK2B]